MWKAVHRLADRGLVHCAHGRRIRIAGPEMPDPETTGAAHRLFHTLKEEILDGTYPTGHTLPKFDYLVTRERVSRDTVARAYRILESRNLACKQGRRWIAGPSRTTTAPESIHFGNSNEYAPVILVLTHELSAWRAICTAERTRAFSDAFYAAIDKAGVRTRVVLTSAHKTSHPLFASGWRGIAETAAMLGDRYLGTLLAGTRITTTDVYRWVPLLVGLGKPVVWFDHNDLGSRCGRNEPGITRGAFYRCHFDEPAAVVTARCALADRGHRQIGIANGRPDYHEWVERRIRLFDSLGTTTNSDCRLHAVNAPPVQGAEMKTDSNRAPRGASRRKPPALVDSEHALLSLLRQDDLTAILAPNDYLAFEYFFLINRMGIRVPDDLSLLSFDNYAAIRSLPVSTIDFGFGHLGYCAAHLFIGDSAVRADRHGDIAARPMLLDRGSLGPPRSSHTAFTAPATRSTGPRASDRTLRHGVDSRRHSGA
jgi:hypothetical protein